ncbi:MAG: VOC family protein [Bacteroidetes bacterium]|nr:VOC family protein [Bacteroidota bacterium]MBK9355698.1 VOC family protein [Bacteroidota bacterium]
MDIQFHHIGCLVEKIEIAIADYKILYPKNSASQIWEIEAQKVKVCFFPISPNSFIEFVEPLDEESPLQKMKKKGNSFYHLAFLCSEFDKALQYYETSGYRKLNEFNSEAFDGKRCAFIYNNEMHLIELIER